MGWLLQAIVQGLKDDATFVPDPPIDPQTAGQFAADLTSAERDFFASAGERTRKDPPPRPTTGDALQDEINDVEVALNRAKQKLDGISQEMAPFKLSLSTGASGMSRLACEQKIRDLTPAFETARAETAEFTDRHKTLLAKRKQREIEQRRSAHCAL